MAIKSSKCQTQPTLRSFKSISKNSKQTLDNRHVDNPLKSVIHLSDGDFFSFFFFLNLNSNGYWVYSIQQDREIRILKIKRNKER